MKKILVISGSLRAQSFNSLLARVAGDMVPEGVHVEYADISLLPLYNADLEGNFPAPAQALSARVSVRAVTKKLSDAKMLWRAVHCRQS